MPELALNIYDFTMRLPDGRTEHHREINNTLARATRKAAGWMTGIWMDNPESTVTCRISLGEGPTIHRPSAIIDCNIDDGEILEVIK
jgi:hypothetical protein